MYVCMYVCTYVCAYVSYIYIYIYMYIYIYICTHVSLAASLPRAARQNPRPLGSAVVIRIIVINKYYDNIDIINIQYFS